LIALTVGDSRPQLVFYLRKGGSAIDLTAASGVDFKLEQPSGGEATWAATITDAEEGKITVTPVAADLDEAGWHRGEAVINWGGGNLQHSLQRFDIYVRAEYGEGP
jgi:hypothetical protein